MGCFKLASIDLPSNLATIGQYAFCGCRSLTSVVIPSSVQNIDQAAFSFCDLLTSIVVDPNNTVYDSRENCNAIIVTSTNELITGCSNTSIPDDVQGIGIRAFYGVANLTSVDIPSSVESIGDYAFFGCHNLTEMTCRTLVPPTLGTEVFADTPYETGTLYVNGSKVRTYRKADQWQDWETILPIPGTEPEGTTILDKAYYDGSEKYYDEVVYVRSFTSTAWQSLYVPFSIPVSVLDEYGLEVAEIYNVHQYDRDEDGVYEETNIDFLKMKVGSTEANCPYMIRAKEIGDVEMVLENVTLSDALSCSIDCSTVKQLFTFTGTYTGVDGPTMYANKYYAMTNSGALKRAGSSNVSLKPQRWYMKIENRDGSPVTYFAPNVRVIELETSYPICGSKDGLPPGGGSAPVGGETGPGEEFSAPSLRSHLWDEE